MSNVNYFDIEKALISAVASVDAVTAREYPGVDLETYPDTMWLKLTNLPASSDPVTIGIGGENNDVGVFQIDVNIPNGYGTGAALTKVTEFARYFDSGRSFSSGSATVRILSHRVLPGRVVNGFYRMSLSVNYYSRSQRIVF